MNKSDAFAIAYIRRLAEKNRDKAAEIATHDGNFTTMNQCEFIAEYLERLANDIEESINE